MESSGNRKIVVKSTEMFNDDFNRANSFFKKKAREKVIFTIQKLRSSKDLQFVAGIPRQHGKFIEIDIGSQHRLIAAIHNDQLICIRMGDHDITRCVASNPPTVRYLDPLPPPFEADFTLHRGLLPFGVVSEPTVDGPEEHVESWLYFLDEQQKKYREEILNDVRNDRAQAHVLFGGPGTGKTSILVDLLVELLTGPQLPSVLLCSASMKTFLECADPDLSPHLKDKQHFFSNSHDIKADVVLFDDPSTPHELEKAFSLHEQGEVRVVIVALDPLQLSGAEDFTDEKLDSLLPAQAWEYPLDVAYRQRSVLGDWCGKCLKVLADSTPFLADHKIREHRIATTRILELSNIKDYPRTGGEILVKKCPSMPEILAFMERCPYSYSHGGWPDLLILHQVPSINTTQTIYQKNYASPRFHVRKFDEFEEMRGVEYKYGIFMIDDDTYDIVNRGFTGSGRRRYGVLKNFRIPLSRIRDRVMICVLPEPQQSDVLIKVILRHSGFNT